MRKVHLIHEGVIWLNQTKTKCGRTILAVNDLPSTDGSTVVKHATDYRLNNIDVTAHGTLVTCPSCLRKM